MIVENKTTISALEKWPYKRGGLWWEWLYKRGTNVNNLS
jgi:hypothetical protein